MKKLILILFTTILYNTTFSQKVVISVFHQNCLIANLDNALEIIAENVPFDSLVVKTNNGQLVKGINFYSIRPKELGNAKISVFKIKNRDTILISEKYFKVINLERYTYASIADKHDGDTISKGLLLAQKIINSIIVDLDIDLHAPVSNYRIIMLHNDSLIFTKQFESNKIEPELLEKFQLLQTGDVIYFVDILCLTPDNKKMKIKPVKLTIK
jgi:hypothetical protein